MANKLSMKVTYQIIVQVNLLAAEIHKSIFVGRLILDSIGFFHLFLMFHVGFEETFNIQLVISHLILGTLVVILFVHFECNVVAASVR